MLQWKHLLVTFVIGLFCISNPASARFVSNDPVSALQHIQKGNIQGFNRYAYANNNPYKFTDPDGRNPLLLLLYAPEIIALGKASLFVGSAGVAAYAGSEAINQYNKPKESTVEDLNPLHGDDTLGDSPEIEELSDDDLIDSVNNPRDSDDPGIVVNTKTGKLINGNTRATELKNRSKDPNSEITPKTKVKIEEYTPDDSMFID